MSDETAPDPVEVTTRYVTTVDDLPSAWAFVMDHIDGLGDDPSIEVKPRWMSSMSVPDMIEHGDDGAGWRRRFGVVVEGMVREVRP